MNKAFAFCVILLMVSCIPYSFAPNIEGNKLLKAKRFKRDLPDVHALVFEDPYDEGVFSGFIRERFRDHQAGEFLNIPIELDSTTYYLSCFERERATRTFNLLPLLIDGVLESNNIDPVLEDSYTTREGTWYIVLAVTDAQGKDCLSESHPNRLLVANYLRILHYDYINPGKQLEVLVKESH